jgi:hypothetical protein
MRYLLTYKLFENVVDIEKTIYTIDQLDQFDIPSEIKDMMSKWSVISKSPYSDSFYSTTDINWGYKPDGSYRVSDHWNFRTRGNLHCRTDKPVSNNVNVSIGRYNSKRGLYEIILSLPSKKRLEFLAKGKERASLLKDPELIEKKREFKELIRSGAVLAEFDYMDAHYKGIVKKYTGTEIILSSDGMDTIFSGSRQNGKFQRITNLKLMNKDGKEINDPLKSDA